MDETDFSALGGRVAYVIRECGLTPAALARQVGCTRAAIDQWIDGQTKNIKNNFLFALADATGFSARWIATGDGVMRPNEHQQQLLTLWEKANEAGQETILRVAEAQAHYNVESRQGLRTDLSPNQAAKRKTGA